MTELDEANRRLRAEYRHPERATLTIENQARELDVQYLLGHSTPDMVRRYSATYNSEKAARAHEAFSPADRLGERLAGMSGPAL